MATLLGKSRSSVVLYYLFYVFFFLSHLMSGVGFSI